MELEICVDSVESAIAAQRGGAQRVELCSALVEGGLTPSAGLIRAVRKQVSIGLHVMIRPRGGDFLYSEEEVGVMCEDLAIAAESGADGVVFGLLTWNGCVDVGRTTKLIERARPMKVTFHRAIDMTRDLQTAVRDVVLTGADRVLTSGGAQSALSGAATLQQMVRTAGDEIQIMVCGGVRAENVASIFRSTGAGHFHAALGRETGSEMEYRPESLRLGASYADDFARKVVRMEDVLALRVAMDALKMGQSSLV